MNPNHLLSCCATLIALTALTGNAPCQRVLAETFGSEVFARYGAAIATVADFDGDGARDLVIGEPDRDQSAATGVIDSGAAVLRSSRSGIVRARQFGLEAFGRFGSTVAGLGDVDGDAVADWAAGSPARGQGDGGAQVMSGADGHVFWSVSGLPASAMGSGIAAIGDCNHDGRPDVAISSPHDSSIRPYGFVRSYAGNNGGIQSMYVGSNNTLIGESIASIADVTGDGQPDLIIGEPQFGAGGSGRVWLVNPRQSGLSGMVWTVSASFQGGWRAGQVVAAAGDVNGDGLPDVMAGTAVGRVIIFSGRDGTELRTHTGSEPGFGQSLAGIGDFDGDGRSDYAIGSPQFAAGNGRVTVFSGSSGNVLAVIDGTAGSNFGAAVTGIGDFDRDGRADFAVGAPLHTNGGQLLGRVSIHGLTISALGDRFGAGCSGARGVPDLNVTSSPLVGSVFETRCANLPPGTAGFWLTGWSNTMAGSTPLPIDLGAFGIPGCQLLVSPDGSLLFVNGPQSGFVSRRYTVPNLPSLAGLEFFTQAVVLDATHVGGMTVSNGGRIRIGNG